MDLGCGPGLWLDLLDEITSPNCKLIGIDSDLKSLEEIKKRSHSLGRELDLIFCDLENEIDKIPKSDIILAFNIFPYLNDPLKFLNKLKLRLNENGKIIIRQYDGGTLRFGPMTNELRFLIDNSLFDSVGASKEFYHYDMDRVYNIINSSNFNKKEIEFEIFQKRPPYSKEYLRYFESTIEWNLRYLSQKARLGLEKWYTENFPLNTYFIEVDLVAELS